MELNNNQTTTKQTLRDAIENEHEHQQQHLCLSDSDSSNSETDDKPVTYSSPLNFHTNYSDSDSDSTKSETVKATKASTLPPVEPQARSSVSSDQISHSPVQFHGKHSDFDSTESEKIKATKTSVLPPVDSPARSSVSSDQISLPHESFTFEDNKTSVAPTVNLVEKPPSPTPEPVVKRSVKEEPLALVKVDPVVIHGIDSVKEGGDSGGKQRQRIRRPELSILRKARRDEIVKKAGLGFRVFGFLFCLVSFSVMAADRNQGWALDSFERYKEFRYCMSVNVIGFVYSGAQAIDLAYLSATGRNLVQHHLRYFVDFAFDQVVTYLLISASSSAATRIDDWQLNWGKDKFPDMATASVAMSFLAFAALAFSSLISGYVLCNSKSL